MSELLVNALIGHVNSSFYGPNGDYPALIEAIAGLTARQAAWQPDPAGNSIWQIVDHLAASKEWQIEMLQKGQATQRAWIEPPGDEASWQSLITRLKDAHVRLLSILGNLKDEELLEYPVPGMNRTLLELVLSAGSAHEAHHGGQISYLHGLQDRLRDMSKR